MDSDANMAIEKASLRALMLARRGLLPEESRNMMSLAIAEHIISLPEVLDASHIHLYLSMYDVAEVSTEPIIDKLAAMNKMLSVPVIRNNDLISASFQKGDSVKTGRFGQPEPEQFSAADECNLDVVLLPLLAFDKKGYRLGYGKGFYDRWLKRLSAQDINPRRIGLSFFQQRVDKLPLDPWDEPLDAVAHELGIICYN